MYWYLRDEHPYDILKEIAALDNTMVKVGDELKSKFELMPDKERVELVRQMASWDSAPGRYIYHPNPKEEWFFLQPHTIKGISGGNRSGKTCTITVDIVAQIEGWHPLQRGNLEKIALNAKSEKVRSHCSRLVDEKKWIASPPIQARCVAVDYPFMEKNNGPEYVKWASQGDLKYIGFDNEKKRKITWKNNSFVEFMSHEQQTDTHGGVSRHVIQYDEESPKEKWDEGMMRIMSANGRMLYGCTGVEGVTWSDEVIWEPGLRGDDPRIYAMEMSTYDNPTVSDEMINLIKSLCTTEEDVEIRIFGKRVRKGGNVYDMARDDYPWVVPVFEEARVFGELGS